MPCNIYYYQKIYALDYVLHIFLNQSSGTNKWRHRVQMYTAKWRSHVYRWLGPEIPGNTTILVVKYENLKANLREELKRMLRIYLNRKRFRLHYEI